MIIEILKYGFIVLSATVQVCFVGMFILGFWNGFTYEVGEKGSKFHFWFQLLPFKRFFKNRQRFNGYTEEWVGRAIVATFKGYTDWMKSDDCRTRYKDTLVDITGEVEIYGLEKNPSGLTKHIQTRLEESGIIWELHKKEDDKSFSSPWD